MVPMTLSPIGGAVARFGLNLPFLISAGVAAVGLGVAARFLEEVDGARTKDDDDDEEEAALDDIAVDAAPPVERPRANPYGDPVLLANCRE